MFDLSTMSTDELRNLQSAVKARLAETKNEELRLAREKVKEIARSAGVTLDDLFLKGKISGTKQTRQRKQKSNATQGA